MAGHKGPDGGCLHQRSHHGTLARRCYAYGTLEAAAPARSTQDDQHLSASTAQPSAPSWHIRLLSWEGSVCGLGNTTALQVPSTESHWKGTPWGQDEPNELHDGKDWPYKQFFFSNLFFYTIFPIEDVKSMETSYDCYHKMFWSHVQ